MNKKIIGLLLVSMICSDIVVTAENYAILVSAGKATSEMTMNNTEYWYDLFLVYEYLIIEEQYDPSNVFVFYGDGYDYNTSNNRYQKELHNWMYITDYDNSYNTMVNVFSTLDNIITDEDNFLLYWVVGHGGNTNYYDSDSYSVKIEHSYGDEFISKNDLLDLINSITHYKKRKVFWMTCYSGAMGEGSYNLNENKTTIITSSSSNELSYSFNDNGDPHSAFNFALYSLSTGLFPNGTTCDITQVTTGVDDIDFMLSINELYLGIDTFLYSDINTLICPLDPRKYDVGNISNKIFIGENKTINGVTYYFNSAYWLDRLEISSMNYDDDFDVSIEIDDKCILKKSVYVPLNSTLVIK